MGNKTGMPLGERDRVELVPFSALFDTVADVDTAQPKPSSSMLNARKREASDPILPTRQPKYPRVEEGGWGTPGGFAVHSGLAARWSQLAREVVELASETIMAWGSLSSPSTELSNAPPRLRRSLPPPPPRSPPRPLHTAPASHLSLHPPIPNELLPRDLLILTEQGNLSSTLLSDHHSMQTFNPTDGSGSSIHSTTTGLTSVPHSAALPRNQTADDILASSVRQYRRAEETNNVLNQRKSKEHIYARKVCFDMSPGCRHSKLTYSFSRNIA